MQVFAERPGSCRACPGHSSIGALPPSPPISSLGCHFLPTSWALVLVPFIRMWIKWFCSVLSSRKTGIISYVGHNFKTQKVPWNSFGNKIFCSLISFGDTTYRLRHRCEDLRTQMMRTVIWKRKTMQEKAENGPEPSLCNKAEGQPWKAGRGHPEGRKKKMKRSKESCAVWAGAWAKYTRSWPWTSLGHPRER